MNQASLDAFDLALLAALQADGRSTHQQLADRVHLSPSQVGRRLAKLEADEVIGTTATSKKSKTKAA